MLLKNKLTWLTAAAVVIVVLPCVMWQLKNSKVAGQEVAQRVIRDIEADFAAKVGSGWRTVNASGGLVGSPFYSIRWWREYFVLLEGNVEDLHRLEANFGQMKSIYVQLIPLGFDKPMIHNHPESFRLAPWWKPETNTSAEQMSLNLRGVRWSTSIYGFRDGTNVLLYIHRRDRS